MPTRLLMPLLALLLAAAAPPSPLNDPSTTEGWIWQQARAGDVADLNKRCGTGQLDIRNREDPLWRADCRLVHPDLLRALLTQPDIADNAPYGVRIRGARITGGLYLRDARVKAAEVWLEASWIAGDAELAMARLDGLLSFDGTLIEGKLFGELALIGGGLTMQRAEFGGRVDLRGARVDGLMAMEGASVARQQTFDAERLHVGAGGLFLTNVKFGGPVVLRDARVDGLVAMDGASVADQQPFDAEGLVGGRELFLRDVKFGGLVDLRDARVDGQTTMDGASVADQQTFKAEGLHVRAGALFLNNVKFGGPVDLRGAQVDGQMTMEGASVADRQPFVAEGLHVGTGGLILRDMTFGGPVDLLYAQVNSVMNMEGASVAGEQPFVAEGLHVGVGGLILRNVKFGGPVDLKDARVDGEMDMDGASVAGQQIFDAEQLHVGAGGLFLTNVKFGGPVVLRDAQVDGLVAMDGASVAAQQTFDAERLRVGGDLFARSVGFGGPVTFGDLIDDGALDLRDSHVRHVDLDGAVVRRDLVLGGRYDNGSEHWLRWDSCDGPAPCLSLRNATVGNLRDDERAWPPHITLEGFSYTHLGGFGGEQRHDMRNRPIRWWRDWLNKDPVYSAQPYAQLAAVLAAGNREGATDIRFFGRDRQRSELLRGCEWPRKPDLVKRPEDARPCRWVAGLGMSALQVSVGYGIGDYSFRAAGWALALALVGTVILCFAPGTRGVRPVQFLTRPRRGPRQKSLLWCFGASLHHVLPLITISQEFSDFFNDPKRERLYSWQHFAFGLLALCGWALGLLVAAAFLGLIQS